MDRLERFEDLQVAVQAALEGWQAGIWTALPAIVQSFDPALMTLTAQPTIKAQLRSAAGTMSWVTLPLLVDCPVVFQGGGGYTLTFPIVEGDEALIIFSSRCMDDWWQSGGVGIQAELRMHDLSDGFALVGLRSKPRALTVATDAVQLRADDGATLIEVNGTTVNITAPGGMLFTGDLKVVGDVEIEGTLKVTETIEADEEITSLVGTPDSVGLTTHTHGVPPETDPPTPGS